MKREQARQAQAFRDLHQAKAPLVLPNAWDVASARIFEASGATAIGTTSMGIAASLGLADGQAIAFDVMLAAVARIVAAVDVPVSADLEAGYGNSTEEIAARVERALETGLVGLNFEDGTGDPEHPLVPTELQAERLAAIRACADAHDLPLVVNARTDVVLARVGPREARLEASIARGNAYFAAGADCVFVPGGLEREEIATLVQGLNGPLNVVANPALSVPIVPPVDELAKLGVARVSIGSGAMRTTLSVIQRIARELLGTGTYELMRQELARDGAPQAYRAAIGEGRPL